METFLATKCKFVWAYIISICLIAFFPQTSDAGLVIAPASASTNMGRFSTFGNEYRIENVINGSGLSIPYISGVTDFNTYIASNPTHIGAAAANVWASQTGTYTGHVDFNLGGQKTIAAFALWNSAQNSSSRVATFTLLASPDDTFANTVNLGSFTTNTSGFSNAVQAEVFTFSATDAAFVRMQITSIAALGGNNVASMGEVAFSAVPELGSAILVGSGLLLALVRKRYNRKLAVE
ncbi:MAG TPA: discoidin domain-containing protein [Lacipirellulaceae bacterium]|nr:discoidin domain-containing protein [Lacipirellulaceae bacterium]